MKLKYGLHFKLEQRRDKKTGEVIEMNIPINMDFTFSGQRFRYFTGYRIDEAKWDVTAERVIRNNFDNRGISATKINNHLDELKTHTINIYEEARALRVNPTVQYMRDELKKRLNEGKYDVTSFFDIFDFFIETESVAGTWTEGTKKKFRTNYNHLKQFEKTTRNKVEFESLNEALLNKYTDFQRGVLGHRNTTISKNLRILKWFLNWATKKGYNKNLAFRDFNPTLKGTTHTGKIIFLTWPELMRLYELEISKTYLDHVRDVFCFGCFTGLRYSDIFNLKRSNIKNDCIEVTTIKTDEVITIDLNNYSRSILEKYKDIPFEDNKCLPVISNQKANEYLKELGGLAELNAPETVVYYKGAQRIEKTFKKWELLTTHVARKTFITNSLYLGIPAEVIMSWTGHKSHKTMKDYYKIVDEQKRREMDKFNIKPKRNGNEQES